MKIVKAQIDTDDDTLEPIVFFKGVIPLEFAQEAIKNPETYGKQLGEELLNQIHDKLKININDS
jgi:hypothetical protein